METSYLTVKEFAARCNVSQQAVYKQLHGKLKEYVRKDGDKTLIAAEAVEVMGRRRQRNEATAEQQLIEVLRAQLETKDKQIEALTEALQTAQQLTRAAQAAQLQAEARLKMIEDTAQEERKGSSQGTDDEAARENTETEKPAEGSGSDRTEAQEETRRVPFWHRWFKR